MSLTSWVRVAFIVLVSGCTSLSTTTTTTTAPAPAPAPESKVMTSESVILKSYSPEQMNAAMNVLRVSLEGKNLCGLDPATQAQLPQLLQALIETKLEVQNKIQLSSTAKEALVQARKNLWFCKSDLLKYLQSQTARDGL